MVKEKKILSYFIGWLIIGFCILFVGVNNVFAEEIQPTEIKSQIRTIYTDGTTQWYTSGINTYSTPLYFGTGPSYSTYGIPCNFRLLVIDNINSSYSYKYSYDMHIFTPYSTNNTWDSSKIDSLYDIYVSDDLGVIKDSKCTVVSTSKNSNALGTFINKKLSCVFSVNKSQNNAYISAGYFCKGNCNLENLEPLGFIPQDSYMTLDNVKIERFNDNSNIIIDQNQTIIDQNNTTNEKLDDVQQSIIDSNKETQDVIKDQFNDCRPSYNLLDITNFANTTNRGITWTLKDDKISISSVGSLNATYSQTKHDFINLSAGSYKYYVFDTNINVNMWLYDENVNLIATVKPNTTFSINKDAKYYVFYFEGTQNTSYNFSFKPAISLSSNTISTFEPYGEEICSNRLDETNDKLDDLQGALTDSSAPSLEILGDSAGWLPPGPLDSVVNLPLTMMNNLLTNLGKTCSTLRVELPFVNKKIEIPCVENLMEKMGALVLWRWVGRIASVIILYGYLMNLYAWADKILTLRAEFDEAMGVDLANWGRL